MVQSAAVGPGVENLRILRSHLQSANIKSVEPLIDGLPGLFACGTFPDFSSPPGVEHCRVRRIDHETAEKLIGDRLPNQAPRLPAIL